MEITGKLSHKKSYSNLSLPGDESGGVAIILVMWVIVILVAIVGEFSFSMKTEKNIARNFKEEEESYQLALAGIEAAKYEILTASSPVIVYRNENDTLSFGINETTDSDEATPKREGALGRGRFKYSVIDEESKLNINSASKEQMRYIFIDSGVGPSEADIIIDSIIDWRDSNDLHQLNGAEEDYYRSLERAYSAKNDLFYSIEELLLVRGMSSEILYGTPSSAYDQQEPEDLFSGVADKLTVYGSKININTAPAVVLEAVLGIERANSVIIQRGESPIASPGGVGKISSDYFTVISTGTNRDGKIKRTVKAVIKKNGRDLDILHWNDNYTG